MQPDLVEERTSRPGPHHASDPRARRFRRTSTTTLASWILPILVILLVAAGVGAQPVDLPDGPRPYRVEEVRYPAGAEGVRLAATLTVPEGQGPFPAVALLSVSGPADRDQSLGGGRKPFLVLADYLTKRGVAVLRTDDRRRGRKYRASPVPMSRTLNSMLFRLVARRPSVHDDRDADDPPPPRTAVTPSTRPVPTGRNRQARSR